MKNWTRNRKLWNQKTVDVAMHHTVMRKWVLRKPTMMRAKPRIHTQLAPNHPLTPRSNHRFGAYFSANHTIECLLKVCEKVCNSLHPFHTLCHLLQLGQHRRTSTGLHHSRSFWWRGCHGAATAAVTVTFSEIDGDLFRRRLSCQFYLVAACSQHLAGWLPKPRPLSILIQQRKALTIQKNDFEWQLVLHLCHCV